MSTVEADVVTRRPPSQGHGRASFLHPLDSVPARSSLGVRYWWEYLRDGRTPIRAISDEAISRCLPYLMGPGAIVELGAPSDYYRRLLPAEQAYRMTDLCANGAERVDMTAMPFADASISAFASFYAIEHVFEYERALSEMQRCLMPGGRLLLVLPFLYYYHGAPDDFVRLTPSAIKRHLSGLMIRHHESIGTRDDLMAELLHEKPEMGHTSGPIRRSMLRVLGSLFLARGLMRPGTDERYASAHLFLCEKVG